MPIKVVRRKTPPWQLQKHPKDPEPWKKALRQRLQDCGLSFEEAEERLDAIVRCGTDDDNYNREMITRRALGLPPR